MGLNREGGESTWRFPTSTAIYWNAASPANRERGKISLIALLAS